MTVQGRLERAEQLYARMEEIRARLAGSEEPSLELLEELAELAKAVHEEIEQARKEAEGAER